MPTASLRLLYGFFVIEHGRRHIVHFNATFHPTSAWVIQQLREAFPYDTAPRYLIFDRDFMHQGTDLWPISKGPSFGTGRDRREVPRQELGAEPGEYGRPKDVERRAVGASPRPVFSQAF